jgi:hypothetical protein
VDAAIFIAQRVARRLVPVTRFVRAAAVDDAISFDDRDGTVVEDVGVAHEDRTAHDELHTDSG